jgi:hypothetical protein
MVKSKRGGYAFRITAPKEFNAKERATIRLKSVGTKIRGARQVPIRVRVKAVSADGTVTSSKRWTVVRR